MPECPRLWTNLSDGEFAMDIGFTKTEKQFSTFAYPLTNVGGHAAIESCPSTNIGAQFPAESCTSANVEEHATIGKEELHFRTHRLFCHRALCRASRCFMLKEQAL